MRRPAIRPRIRFQTATLMLPFTLSFLDDVVPDNYRLPVTASVSGGNMTAPNIYRPLYKDWEIQKFVNSNRIGAFGKDGAEVVVTPQEEREPVSGRSDLRRFRLHRQQVHQ
ncbi:MAG: hypothetical protein ACLUFI_09715 [Oscillospiraceae bacterium]